MVVEDNQSLFPLSVRGLRIQKRDKTILDDVSLTLDKTGFTVVMGPNGSGKSTLLRALHGLERLSSGSIDWNSHEGSTQSKQTFVFQTPKIMRRSVFNNIAYPLQIAGVEKAAIQEKVKRWAQKTDLANKLELEANFLSGGERQKMALARALVTRPQLLFLDEPTTNLDGLSTRQIESLLIEAHDTSTRIIMATHDLGQAKRLASDVIFLNKGQVCEKTPASTFFNQPQSTEAQAYLRGEILE